MPPQFGRQRVRWQQPTCHASARRASKAGTKGGRRDDVSELAYLPRDRTGPAPLATRQLLVAWRLRRHLVAALARPPDRGCRPRRPLPGVGRARVPAPLLTAGLGRAPGSRAPCSHDLGAGRPRVGRVVSKRRHPVAVSHPGVRPSAAAPSDRQRQQRGRRRSASGRCWTARGTAWRWDGLGPLGWPDSVGLTAPDTNPGRPTSRCEAPDGPRAGRPRAGSPPGAARC